MINAWLETVANIKILFKVQTVSAKDSRMQSAGLFPKGPASVYLLSEKLSQLSLLSCSFVSYSRAICSFSKFSFNLSLDARPNELGRSSIDNSFVLDMFWRSDILYM